MYWDNIAGPTLQAVLATIQNRGRIVGCGGNEISSFLAMITSDARINLSQP